MSSDCFPFIIAFALLSMKEFPKSIAFKYPWRKYQKRVLDELSFHLTDNHLHIIAPPGSGKTVLGLEVALRLNKPTLIFAPSVAIRNQWIQRFCELFLQSPDVPSWISKDIRKPEFLTVVTYQALHAASTNSVIEDEVDALDSEEEEGCESVGRRVKVVNTDEVVRLLRQKGVGTIVLDEAHHLKNEWWKPLNSLKCALSPTMVGLTATPPYDVSYSEWKRYVDLNGPVDAEISVPELVLENDLCPHQDYLYLSEPTDEEKQIVLEQRKRAGVVFDDLKTDTTLVTAFSEHPAFVSPLQNLDWIYSNLECYSALLIFLKAAGLEIAKVHLDVIGNKQLKIPQLTYRWAEVLLMFYLFTDKQNFMAYEEHKEKLIGKLKRNGLLEKHTVSFTYNHRISNSLGSSLSKLQSISRIVDVEYGVLGADLRMVILTDYIRKEYLVSADQNNLPLHKIGVLPIFEQLRRTNNQQIKVGILSGSLVVVPTQALPNLIAKSKELGVDSLGYTSLPYDDRYFIVSMNEAVKHLIVRLITQIFEQGEMHVLIGTKSLLGEGWDAPTINSLILASFVGSYVLSNQMRGRAIRTTLINPDKTGNIWHLACIDPTRADGGEDIELLKRRFKTFVGVSSVDDSIENGINRLGVPLEFNSASIAEYNGVSTFWASQRGLIKNKWQSALQNGNVITEEIKVPYPRNESYTADKTMYYNRTIMSFMMALGASLLAFVRTVLEGMGRTARNLHSKEDFLKFLMIVGLTGLVIFGRRFYKALRLLIMYRDISKDVQAVGEALLASLVKMGTIKTSASELEVKSSVDSFGSIYCHLHGGTTFEKSIFIKSLQEIIGVIDNPRYIIKRKNSLLRVFSQHDYHSVPELIGQHKRTAEYLEEMWRQRVGGCKLIYTRTLEGRKDLLKSRVKSLSAELADDTERISRWT